MSIETGLTATAAMTVADGDTAAAVGSGSVEVLATPRLIALMEEATVAAMLGQTAATETTVGMRVQIDHLAPTSVGEEVTAEATLEKIQGRRLVFTVSASDRRGLIAAGKVTRVVVDTERFLDKAR